MVDPAKEIRSFTVALSVPMGAKRGRGRGAFIDSVMGAIDSYYESVVQRLAKASWSAAPPKLRSEVEPPPEVRPSLSSTALSSQDGVEPVVEQATEPAPQLDAEEVAVPVAAGATEGPREAGWYDDPEGVATSRFWDGQDWTSRIRMT